MARGGSWPNRMAPALIRQPRLSAGTAAKSALPVVAGEGASGARHTIKSPPVGWGHRAADVSLRGSWGKAPATERPTCSAGRGSLEPQCHIRAPLALPHDRATTGLHPRRRWSGSGECRPRRMSALLGKSVSKITSPKEPKALKPTKVQRGAPSKHSTLPKNVSGTGKRAWTACRACLDHLADAESNKSWFAPIQTIRYP